MKTKTIRVEVMDRPIVPGNEHMAASYPHDGVFELPDGRLIARHGTFAYLMASPAGMSLFSDEVDAAPTSVDMSALLKAIAISQKPDLALELCK